MGRCVLTQKAQEKMAGGQGVVDPVKEPDGILFLTGKHHMAEQDTALKKGNGGIFFPEILKDRRAAVKDHAQDRSGSDFKIVLCAGVSG